MASGIPQATVRVGLPAAVDAVDSARTALQMASPLARNEGHAVAVNRLAIAALLVCGCINAPAPPTPPGPDKQDVQPSTVLDVAGVAEELALRIDKSLFRHSDELLQTVQHLTDAGELSKADADRLIDACTGIRAKRRDLTAEDAAALRGVK